MKDGGAELDLGPVATPGECVPAVNKWEAEIDVNLELPNFATCNSEMNGGLLNQMATPVEIKEGEAALEVGVANEVNPRPALPAVFSSGSSYSTGMSAKFLAISPPLNSSRFHTPQHVLSMSVDEESVKDMVAQKILGECVASYEFDFDSYDEDEENRLLACSGRNVEKQLTLGGSLVELSSSFGQLGETLMYHALDEMYVGARWMDPPAPAGDVKVMLQPVSGSGIDGRGLDLHLAGSLSFSKSDSLTAAMQLKLQNQQEVVKEPLPEGGAAADGEEGIEMKKVGAESAKALMQTLSKQMRRGQNAAHASGSGMGGGGHPREPKNSKSKAKLFGGGWRSATDAFHQIFLMDNLNVYSVLSFECWCNAVKDGLWMRLMSIYVLTLADGDPRQAGFILTVQGVTRAILGVVAGSVLVDAFGADVVMRFAGWLGVVGILLNVFAFQTFFYNTANINAPEQDRSELFIKLLLLNFVWAAFTGISNVGVEVAWARSVVSERRLDANLGRQMLNKSTTALGPLLGIFFLWTLAANKRTGPPLTMMPVLSCFIFDQRHEMRQKIFLREVRKLVFLDPEVVPLTGGPAADNTTTRVAGVLAQQLCSVEPHKRPTGIQLGDFCHKVTLHCDHLNKYSFVAARPGFVRLTYPIRPSSRFASLSVLKKSTLEETDYLIGKSYTATINLLPLFYRRGQPAGRTETAVEDGQEQKVDTTGKKLQLVLQVPEIDPLVKVVFKDVSQAPLRATVTNMLIFLDPSKRVDCETSAVVCSLCPDRDERKILQRSSGQLSDLASMRMLFLFVYRIRQRLKGSGTAAGAEESPGEDVVADPAAGALSGDGGRVVAAPSLAGDAGRGGLNDEIVIETNGSNKHTEDGSSSFLQNGARPLLTPMMDANADDADAGSSSSLEGALLFENRAGRPADAVGTLAGSAASTRRTSKRKSSRQLLGPPLTVVEKLEHVVEVVQDPDADGLPVRTTQKGEELSPDANEIESSNGPSKLHAGIMGSSFSSRPAVGFHLLGSDLSKTTTDEGLTGSGTQLWSSEVHQQPRSSVFDSDYDLSPSIQVAKNVGALEAATPSTSAHRAAVNETMTRQNTYSVILPRRSTGISKLDRNIRNQRRKLDSGGLYGDASLTQYQPNLYGANVILFCDLLNALATGFSGKLIPLFLVQEYEFSPFGVLWVAFFSNLFAVLWWDQLLVPSYVFVAPYTKNVIHYTRQRGYPGKVGVLVVWLIGMGFLSVLCVPRSVADLPWEGVAAAVIIRNAVNGSAKSYLRAKLVNYLPYDKVTTYMAWDTLNKAQQGGLVIFGTQLAFYGGYRVCFLTTLLVLAIRWLVFLRFILHSEGAVGDWWRADRPGMTAMPDDEAPRGDGAAPAGVRNRNPDSTQSFNEAAAAGAGASAGASTISRADAGAAYMPPTIPSREAGLAEVGVNVSMSNLGVDHKSNHGGGTQSAGPGLHTQKQKAQQDEDNLGEPEEEQLVRRTSASRVDTLEKKKVQAENRNASGGATQDVSGCPATGDPAACIQAAYDEVFANYENNRNAGSHLWMNYITQKLKDGTITFARFQELSTFFCPISGSPLGPNRDRLKSSAIPATVLIPQRCKAWSRLRAGMVLKLLRSGCGQLRGLTTTAYEKETANWQRPTECDTQMACSLSSFLQKQAEGGAASALELEKRLVDHPASYHNSGRSHVVFRSTTERAGVLLRAYNKNRASMKSKPSSLSSDFLRTTDGGVAFLSRGAKVEAVKDKAVSGEDDFLYRSEPTARDRQLQRKLKFLARVFPFSAVSSSWRSLLGSRFSTASDAVGGAGKPAGEQLLFLSVATGCEGSGSPAEKKKCFADVKKRMYDAMHANHQKLMQAMHWRSLAATVFEPHDAVPLRYFPRQHEHLFFSAATRKESVVFKKLLAVEDLDRSADDSTSRTNKNVEQDNVVIDVLAPLGVMAVFSLFLVIQFRRRRALITKKDHLSDAETSSAGSKGSKASSTAQLFGKRRL
eukprot:g4210.t1